MWSAQQQSMLNAMGYTLYVRPGSQVSVAQAEASTIVVAAGSAATADSALFKAVMKVVQGRDISRLGIDVEALRGNPQAKRALWAQLRRVIKS
ncbi:MAG: hypothetical protein ACREO1_07190 [Arenimonas sp.]